MRYFFAFFTSNIEKVFELGFGQIYQRKGIRGDAPQHGQHHLPDMLCLHQPAARQC